MEFLAQEWGTNQRFAEKIGDCTLYVTYGEKCSKIFVDVQGRMDQYHRHPQPNFFKVKTMPYLLFAEVFHNELRKVYRDTLRFKHNLVFTCVKLISFKNVL